MYVYVFVQLGDLFLYLLACVCAQATVSAEFPAKCRRWRSGRKRTVMALLIPPKPSLVSEYVFVLVCMCMCLCNWVICSCICLRVCVRRQRFQARPQQGNGGQPREAPGEEGARDHSPAPFKAGGEEDARDHLPAPSEAGGAEGTAGSNR